MSDIYVDSTGAYVSLGFSTKRNEYIIYLWYNDMFAWASSWCIYFPCGLTSAKDAVKKFHAFLDKPFNKAVFDQFSQVPYPSTNENGQYIWQEVERYFSMNRKIGNQVNQIIKEETGYENESLDWKPKEEPKHLLRKVFDFLGWFK